MSGIRISPKHGVNPSLQQCFCCGEDVGLVLFGRLQDDKEAPKRVCLSREPCDKCKGYMKQGIIIVTVRDGETDMDNPYRMGGFFVVTEDMIQRLHASSGLPASWLEQVLKARFLFMEQSVAEQIGLLDEAKKHEEKNKGG